MFIEHERLSALRQGAAHSKAEGYVNIRSVDLRWLVALVDHYLAQEAKRAAAAAASESVIVDSPLAGGDTGEP